MDKFNTPIDLNIPLSIAGQHSFAYNGRGVLKNKTDVCNNYYTTSIVFLVVSLISCCCCSSRFFVRGEQVKL